LYFGVALVFVRAADMRRGASSFRVGVVWRISSSATIFVWCALADVLVMQEGCVIAARPAAHLFESPQSDYPKTLRAAAF
jgi:hypothetical protein